MAFESLILDARGNPFHGVLDAIGGETVTDARVSSGTLGSRTNKTERSAWLLTRDAVVPSTRSKKV